MKTQEYLYNELMKEFNNSLGVCALIGQLKYESNLEPTNLQNSGNKKLNMSDEEYTQAVDNGSYGNFVYDAQGYGLAQWTFWARKKNLLDYAKMKGLSIGSLELQTQFLIIELRGYKTSYNAIKNAKDIYECSEILTKDFEKPSDQSESACKRRANFGLSYYQELRNKAVVSGEVYKEEKHKEDYELYEVQPKDCLWNIAKLFYNNGSMYTEIMKDNNLSSTTIHPGDILKIRRK